MERIYCAICERPFPEDFRGGDGLVREDGELRCLPCRIRLERQQEQRGFEIDAILEYIPSLRSAA